MASNAHYNEYNVHYYVMACLEGAYFKDAINENKLFRLLETNFGCRKPENDI